MDNRTVYTTPVKDWIEPPLNLRKLQQRRKIVLRLLVLGLTFCAGIFVGANLWNL